MRVIVLAAAAACVPPVAQAQGGADPHPSTRPAPAALPSPRVSAAPEASGGPAGEPAGPEPRAAWHIAEDDHVRIEELRVRGESRHITVQPKLPGARPYEIVPASGALDPSQRGRRAPGQSQWRVLSF